MAQCTKIRKKKRQYCVGDLRDTIDLLDRNITAPTEFSSVDYDEEFQTTIPGAGLPAAINTVTGKTFFDGVNTETPITHTVGIRFQENVTAENWVLFDSRRLDILKVENLDERSLWLELTCVDRGLATKEASKA